MLVKLPGCATEKKKRAVIDRAYNLLRRRSLEPIAARFKVLRAFFQDPSVELAGSGAGRRFAGTASRSSW